MRTVRPGVNEHCAYCGRSLAANGMTPERFGEPFCSEKHADEFVAEVRAARAEAAVRAEKAEGAVGASPPAQACGMSQTGQHGWTTSLKRAACWVAPLLLLLAVPLVWSGGWAATGGSLLSVLVLLACPVSMYFMMRGMMGMQRPSRDAEVGPSHEKEKRHA